MITLGPELTESLKEAIAAASRELQEIATKEKETVDRRKKVLAFVHNMIPFCYPDQEQQSAETRMVPECYRYVPLITRLKPLRGFKVTERILRLLTEGEPLTNNRIMETLELTYGQAAPALWRLTRQNRIRKIVDDDRTLYSV